MKKQSTTIISIILLILIVIFALLNTEKVTVNLLATQVQVPLVLLIFSCLLIGALIIYLLSLSNHYQLKKELKDLRTAAQKPRQSQRQIAELKKENARLQAQLQQATTPAPKKPGEN